MKKINKIKAVVFVVVALFLATAVVNAEVPDGYPVDDGAGEESLTYEEHIAILDTLPYFLEGTILDGNTRVVVTEDGISPDFLDPSQYDMVISRDMRHQIIEDAHATFIAMYGIDPYPPEPPEEPWPYPYPHGIQSLAEISDEISTLSTFEISEHLSEEVSTLTSTEISEISTFIHESVDFYQDSFQSDVIELEPSEPTGDGPHASDGGNMILHVFLPTDDAHMPRNPDSLIHQCAIDGWNRFEQFGIAVFFDDLWGYWDASDVDLDAYDQLYDFRDDWYTFGLTHRHFIVNMGLVRLSNHNGIAYRNDFWCIVTERSTFLNFAKDRIAQHELTHCIGDIPDDGGWWPWNHGWRRCVVNYFYMFFGTNTWCGICQDKLYDEIWNI